MGTLWNTYAFFILYADIDQFDPKAHPLDKAELTLMDRWALSRLNTLVRTVDEHLDHYRITEASRAMADFVDDLSNWYVRRSRERFWGKGMAGDKEAAFATLYHVLVTGSQVSAPFIPFLSEEIWQNLVVNNVPGAVESVHLSDFPVSDSSRIDKDMEKQMDALLEVIQLGRACRNAANLKVRQPLAKLYVKGAAFEQAYQELCEDELNVREVLFTEDARAFTTYRLKPQMRTLGPKYGKLLGKIGQHLAEMDGNDVVDAFGRGETVSFDIEGTKVELAKDDVLTEPMQKPGFTAMEDKGVTVVLDTNLSDELIREGYAREVISKLQTMRKEAGFEVTDRIHVTYEGDDELAAALEAFGEMITRTTLALSLKRGSAEEGAVSREWDINGKKATLSVRKNG